MTSVKHAAMQAVLAVARPQCSYDCAFHGLQGHGVLQVAAGHLLWCGGPWACRVTPGLAGAETLPACWVAAVWMRCWQQPNALAVVSGRNVCGAVFVFWQDVMPAFMPTV